MFVNTDNTEIHTLGLFAMTYVITSVLNITFELSLLKQLLWAQVIFRCIRLSNALCSNQMN